MFLKIIMNLFGYDEPVVLGYEKESLREDQDHSQVISMMMKSLSILTIIFEDESYGLNLWKDINDFLKQKS